MRQLFLGFFQVMMRSLIMMGIMLTITLSIITREFPPDFRRIARAYEQVQNFHGSAALPVENSIEKPQTETLSIIASQSEESEIAQLSGLYEKRAMIGRALLDPNTKSATPRTTEATAAVESSELQILRAQLLTCHDRLKLYENLDPDTPSDEDQSQ